MPPAQAAFLSYDRPRSTRELQRKAGRPVDMVNVENSTGFHAAQEAARILGEASISHARAGPVFMRHRAQASRSSGLVSGNPAA